MARDWAGWHDAYDVPGSGLQRRLAAVQERIAAVLDARPAGPIRAVSVCAGQGRDLLGVLAGHPRRADVRARLVELDPRNVAAARAAAAGSGGVEVVMRDAGDLGAYRDAVPADLVLVCGVFGNLSDAAVRGAVALLPVLCAPGGTVIWTRYPRDPDLLDTIDGWFRDAGFDRVVLDGGGGRYGLGVHRYHGDPAPLPAAGRLFGAFDRGPLGG